TAGAECPSSVVAAGELTGTAAATASSSARTPPLGSAGCPGCGEVGDDRGAGDGAAAARTEPGTVSCADGPPPASGIVDGAREVDGAMASTGARGAGIPGAAGDAGASGGELWARRGATASAGGAIDERSESG